MLATAFVTFPFARELVLERQKTSETSLEAKVVHVNPAGSRVKAPQGAACRRPVSIESISSG